MDDESFYRLYYGNTSIPKDIPIRVRKFLVEQLGSRWRSVKPEDWVIEDDELDFAELLYEMEDEFGVSIPHDDMVRLDASFDSIVRYLAGRIHLIKNLAHNWLDLCTSFSAPPSLAERRFQKLVDAYSEPGRHYHTLRHLDEMFATIETLKESARDLAAIQFAAWFHDVVYDSRAKDNEEKSAACAAKALEELRIPQPLINRVTALILTTKLHQANADDVDCQILLDADLAILGAESSRYAEYAQAIRMEYDWVPEADFHVGRKKVLESFLARERIYSTARMLEEFEEQARRNIENELSNS